VSDGLIIDSKSSFDEHIQQKG